MRVAKTLQFGIVINHITQVVSTTTTTTIVIVIVIVVVQLGVQRRLFSLISLNGSPQLRFTNRFIIIIFIIFIIVMTIFVVELVLAEIVVGRFECFATTMCGVVDITTAIICFNCLANHIASLMSTTCCCRCC